MSVDGKLDALLVAVGEIRTDQAVLSERQDWQNSRIEGICADMQMVRESLHGSGSRSGLATKVALLERRGQNGVRWVRWVGPGLAGLLAAGASLLTAWASK